MYRESRNRYGPALSPQYNYNATYTRASDTAANPTLGGEVAAMLMGIPAGSMSVTDSYVEQDKYFALYIHDDWKVSRHAPKGIGCVECHRAEKGDADAYDHEGFLISTLVTPKDCMRCHDREAKEFARSHHAKGAQFTGSLDNFLGNVVEGPEIVTTGCAGCHGSIITVMENGKLHPATWPNSGIGRVNPDGSKGTCAACHATGLGGAPKLTEKRAWGPRLAGGKSALLTSVVKGKGAMPPKAGNPGLSEGEIRAAVEFMAAQAK